MMADYPHDSGRSHFLVGNTLAKSISNNKYHLLITALILAYGVASFSDMLI